MKIDGFLKVPDCPGPSTRDGHEEEIEIHAIRFTMEAPYDPNTFGRRGRVAMGLVTFVKYCDMATPPLAQALFQNKTLDEVKFTARRTIEGETVDYFTITLTKATILKFDMHQPEEAAEADLIEEDVSFAYQKIELLYVDGDPQPMDVQVGK
ncbi:type VI secretion system tube protein Hcp [Amaricoccus sp.]|uniref:Hcp family type VI secretion system effector n=1 Tax=Amaricoccus sp. TaxID=1872485 RepID=UPI001B63D574|nr:type VI secretion system tube protein Hcp [Amaricoccus sp.]MBP7000306.1 type VI secretion system tube protein Hcp [Amaricoccus sp.]